VDASNFDLMDVNANAATKLPVVRSASGGPSGQPSAYFPGIADNAGETGRPYLRVPNASSLYANSGTLNAELSFNCWFKTVRGAGNRDNQLFVAANSLAFSVHSDPAGTLSFIGGVWFDGAWKGFGVYSALGDFSTNPAMLTMVYSTAAGVVTTYVNGVVTSTAGNAVTGGFVALHGDVYGDLLIGSRTDAYVNALGYISHAGLWHRALSLREVQDLYNNGTGLLY
jgi:hypothetical protein